MANVTQRQAKKGVPVIFDKRSKGPRSDDVAKKFKGTKKG